MPPPWFFISYLSSISFQLLFSLLPLSPSISISLHFPLSSSLSFSFPRSFSISLYISRSLSLYTSVTLSIPHHSLSLSLFRQGATLYGCRCQEPVQPARYRRILQRNWGKRHESDGSQRNKDVMLWSNKGKCLLVSLSILLKLGFPLSFSLHLTIYLLLSISLLLSLSLFSLSLCSPLCCVTFSFLF